MSTEEPWTIARLLDWTAHYLGQKGIESPLLEAQLLLAHALGCRRIELYTRHEEVPAEEERQRFRALVQQRAKGSPVAHLIGRKEFYSLEFEVSPAVLVPRPDTETLVDEALRLAKGLTAPRVLDVGTGSGCIAVAVARHHKEAQVTAIDRSPEALAVATRNAAKHGLGERIRFLEGDLFAPLPAGERFDLILSNPPYIASAEVDALEPGVRDHEPRLALDGGPDGFAVFDRLVQEAPRYLEPGGYLIVEIGAAQEVPARQRIEAVGGYELAETVRDGAGRPRVLRARRPA